MSSHCHDEHAGHGGGHGHHDHEHDHSDDITPALQHNLYEHIEFDKIDTMNESRRDSGKAIVKKTWSERLEVEPELQSDCDEQILMHIPFTGQVKLHAIMLRSSPDRSAPKTLRLFQPPQKKLDISLSRSAITCLLTYLTTTADNKDDLDFTNIDGAKPTQEFQLSQTAEVQEIPVKRALLNNVRRLSLYIVDNFATQGSQTDSDDEEADDAGDDDAVDTRLSYLGFKGEWMQLGRAPAQILYEAAPNPSDHALKGTHSQKMGRHL
ncbi:hypothetical protein EKO27_g10487 [Xylaria grammica]|uniref:PITH domain-containing protein n=1 Tax=Xylaria grammica TaxID=363999 RepID=A0A439CR36_9PEZI|nr:hypothetical protein EKO27_g10487 [Xylaria grammica]